MGWDGMDRISKVHAHRPISRLRNYNVGSWCSFPFLGTATRGGSQRVKTRLEECQDRYRMRGNYARRVEGSLQPNVEKINQGIIDATWKPEAEIINF